MSDAQPSIAASILTADFGHLDRVIHKLERAGVDRIHLDVMDGHFVPNLTFGPDIVAAFRRLTDLPLDVHLMISEPSVFVPRFLEARPETVTFHVEVDESDETKAATLAAIRLAGAGPGLAIDPATSADAIRAYLPLLDVAMVMTVEPGFGGQRFLAAAAPKMAVIAGWQRDGEGKAQIHVDGGVNRETARLAGHWGADVLIVGSALFQRGQDAADEVRMVRDRAAEARRDAEAQELAERTAEAAPIAASPSSR